MLDRHEHKHPSHNFDGIVENRSNRPPAYFTVLFYGLIVWGVIFSAYYLLSGWSSQEEFAQKMATITETATTEATPQGSADWEQLATTAAETPDGAALFAQHCAMCHGDGGEGGFGPALNTDNSRYGNDREALEKSISEGRGSNMPAFAGRLSPKEITAVTEHLLSLR